MFFGNICAAILRQNRTFAMLESGWKYHRQIVSPKKLDGCSRVRITMERKVLTGQTIGTLFSSLTSPHHQQSAPSKMDQTHAQKRSMVFLMFSKTKTKWRILQQCVCALLCGYWRQTSRDKYLVQSLKHLKYFWNWDLDHLSPVSLHLTCFKIIIITITNLEHIALFKSLPYISLSSWEPSWITATQLQR